MHTMKKKIGSNSRSFISVPDSGLDQCQLRRLSPGSPMCSEVEAHSNLFFPLYHVTVGPWAQYPVLSEVRAEMRCGAGVWRRRG